MAMTDKQFKGLVRFLMDALRDVQTEEDPEKQKTKLEKILQNLQGMV